MHKERSRVLPALLFQERHDGEDLVDDGGGAEDDYVFELIGTQ